MSDSELRAYADSELRAYANCEYDLLRARFASQLTEREYREARALAYFAFGYRSSARRAWAKAMTP